MTAFQARQNLPHPSLGLVFSVPASLCSAVPGAHQHVRAQGLCPGFLHDSLPPSLCSQATSSRGLRTEPRAGGCSMSSRPRPPDHFVPASAGFVSLQSTLTLCHLSACLFLGPHPCRGWALLPPWCSAPEVPRGRHLSLVVISSVRLCSPSSGHRASVSGFVSVKAVTQRVMHMCR